jgi:hypothetical protein
MEEPMRAGWSGIDLLVVGEGRGCALGVWVVGTAHEEVARLRAEALGILI